MLITIVLVVILVLVIANHVRTNQAHAREIAALVQAHAADKAVWEAEIETVKARALHIFNAGREAQRLGLNEYRVTRTGRIVLGKKVTVAQATQTVYPYSFKFWCDEKLVCKQAVVTQTPVVIPVYEPEPPPWIDEEYAVG